MESILEISGLVCPETRQQLRPATPEELASVRSILTQPLSGALVTLDSSRAYPVVSGIPILLADAAVPLTSSAPDTIS